jgi:hypothetical protein
VLKIKNGTILDGAVAIATRLRAERSEIRILKETRDFKVFTPPKGFEPTIPASERRQTHALNRATTGAGIPGVKIVIYF